MLASLSLSGTVCVHLNTCLLLVLCSVSDPDPDHPKELEGPCPYDQGLRSKHSNYKFRVVDADAYMADDNSIATNAGDGNRKGDRPIRPLGLISDEDTLWTKNKRERQGHQVRSHAALICTNGCLLPLHTCSRQQTFGSSPSCPKHITHSSTRVENPGQTCTAFPGHPV